MRRFSLLALLMSLGAGCTRVPSSGVKTAVIEAQFTVQPSNDGTSAVKGVLKVGSDYLTLDQGDTISASAGSDIVVMAEKRDFWGATSFEGTLPTDVPGTPVTVTFTRGDGQARATSTVTIPSRFDLAPIVVANSSRSSPIRLVWTNPVDTGESMHWSAAGDCIRATSGDIPAGALFATIPANTLIDADEESPVTCTVTFSVSRSTSGLIAPGFTPESQIQSVRTLANGLVLSP